MSWIFFWTYSASCYRLTFAKQPLQVWYSLNCQLPAFQDRQDTRNNLTDAAGSPSLKVIAPKKCANYVSCCLRCGKLMLASYMPVIYIYTYCILYVYMHILSYIAELSPRNFAARSTFSVLSLEGCWMTGMSQFICHGFYPALLSSKKQLINMFVPMTIHMYPLISVAGPMVPFLLRSKSFVRKRRRKKPRPRFRHEQSRTSKKSLNSHGWEFDGMRIKNGDSIFNLDLLPSRNQTRLVGKSLCLWMIFPAKKNLYWSGISLATIDCRRVLLEFIGIDREFFRFNVDLIWFNMI